MRRFIFPILLLIVTALFLGPLAIASGNYAVGIVPPFEGGAPQVFTATDASPTGTWALPSIAQANTLYVATNGNDSNNCSIGSPCATYAHAYTVALVGTPSITNAWACHFGPGIFHENIMIQPWLFITGDTAQVTQFFGNMTLGSGFTGSSLLGSGVQGVYFEGGTQTFDFTVGPATNAYLLFNYTTFAGDGLSVVSNSGTDDILVFQDSAVLNNVTLANVAIDSITTQWLDVSYSASTTSQGWLSEQDTIVGNLALSGASANPVTMLGTALQGSLSFSGTGSTFTGNISSIPTAGAPTFSGGATSAQYQIDGLLPLPNIDPTGSTVGQVITSTGPTTAPAWSLPTWVSLAAGGTLAPSPAQTRIVFDTTGAAGLVNLPASGTAVDGEEHLVKGLGATVTGSMTVNAGSGNTVESYASPGTLTGAAIIATTVHAGWVANWKYQLSTHEWILQGIY